MGTLMDFGFKQEDTLLQSFGDKLPEINSLIDWKFFLIIFESIFFNKTVDEGLSGTKVIIC
jgi:hypothetical protein